ncbi:hypothetical protein BGZ96_007118 [Linnemannia gamsii]|uniref:Uncharacterized protein n=1 Tax=Linnemannia gamsii TaxID=64522 RepID=A0ABQ7K1R7_9FUNG|nr:hypothetical protein BGZ96_007118 [Linnemannia gamsii]
MCLVTITYYARPEKGGSIQLCSVDIDTTRLPKGVKLQVDSDTPKPNLNLNPKPKLKTSAFVYDNIEWDLSETPNVPICQQKEEEQQSAPVESPITVVTSGLPSSSLLSALTAQKSSAPPPALAVVDGKGRTGDMNNDSGDIWFQKLAFTLWTDTAQCQTITDRKWDEMVGKFGHFYITTIQGYEGKVFELVQDQEDYRSSKNIWCKDKCAMPEVEVVKPRKKKIKKADGSVKMVEEVQQQRRASEVI